VDALEQVFSNYISASTDRDPTTGSLKQKRVPASNPPDVERQIREVLQGFLADALAQSGRAPESYSVYGGHGQVNFFYAKVPWVAALRLKITDSTQRGYYVVLLFREDMQGCALSLNQGYTRFQQTFGTHDIALRKIRESAATAATYLSLPANFVRGQIDLAATSELGKGYEQGAIASKIYRRGDGTTETQLAADFVALLDAYDELFDRIGPDIVAVAPPASEDEYQEAAAALSAEPKQKPYEAPPPGPVPRPPRSPRGTGSGYRRDPKVAAEALKSSTYECAADATHQSFIARKTKMNFVEAHHLVPMQFQERFEPSLDVLENVVVLCPTCHRKLHHGQIADKKVILTLLHQARDAGLRSRGLEITQNDLVALYKGKLEDE